jgi:hypothetical protein
MTLHALRQQIGDPAFFRLAVHAGQAGRHESASARVAPLSATVDARARERVAGVFRDR